MGNAFQSNADLELEKKYRIVKQSHYDLTLLQDLETKNQYCLKCCIFNSIEGLQACVQKMNIKKRISHQHLLSIKDVFSRSENTFCSNIHKVFVVIQYPFRTLQEEIEERRANWDYFSQTQIWSILYSCSMALNYLYSTNLTHESLTSNRIYIQNNGIIKICDPGLLAHTNNVLTYITKSNSEHVYLSPQQISKLPSTETNPLQVEPSDVFILGMIILEVIHLQGMEEIYDNGINYKTLAAKINAISHKYSPKLRTIIQKMLANRPQERTTFDEIQNYVQNDNIDDNSKQSSPSTIKHSKAQSRKPLNSIPSQSNLQNSRKEEVRPTKISLGSKNKAFSNQSARAYPTTFVPETKTNEDYSKFIVLDSNTRPPLPKLQYSSFAPTSNFNYSVAQNLFTPGYAPNNFLNPYSNSNNSSNLTFTNPLTTPQNTNVNKNFNSYPGKMLLPQLNDNFLTKISIPSSPIMPSFQVHVPHSFKNNFDNYSQDLKTPIPELANPKCALPEYQYQSLTGRTYQKITPEVNPPAVQRLQTIDQIQQVQKSPDKQILTEQPNLTIVQVTQSETSGVEAHSGELNKSKSDIIYVNQDDQSGSHYQGYKLNGKKHGFGRLYYQDGGYYQGEWKNNKMNGFAKLYYQSGQIAYEGYWMNDKLHGKGKVFNDNPVQLHCSFDYKDFTGLDDHWLYYDGQFQMDAKQGFGSIKLTSGEIFQGEFEKDVIDGKGKFYSSEGKVITGIWRQNKLVQTQY